MNHHPVPSSSPESIIIFQPTIWSTTTPFGELDSNGHKSNSTYFTDLDLARNNHIWSMFRTGLRLWAQNSPPIFPSPRGAIFASLGGVTCTFKKAIPPGQKLDIVTRIVTWDSKWIYLKSQFVARGTFRPAAYSDQPWRNASKELNGKPYDRESLRNTIINGHVQGLPGDQSTSTVFAVSFQRIVFKKGRQTIPPSRIMLDSGLLPSNFRFSCETSNSGHKGNSEEAIAPEAMIGTSVEHIIEEQWQNGQYLVQHFAVLDEELSLPQGDNVAFSIH
jgi:acyl-CoA thioesterase FadM